MKIPNFKTEEGAVLYKNTVGKLIAPRVADILIDAVDGMMNGDNTKQSSSILDIGCGPGTVSLTLASKYPGTRIVGIDSSKSMVSHCRTTAADQGYQNTEFMQLDAAEISVDKNPFDIVVSNLAFPFFPHPTDSMKAVYHVMKPGGTTIFTVPGRHTWEEFFEVAKSVVGPITTMARPFLTKFSQAEQLPEAMKVAGFSDMTLESKKIPFSFENGHEVLNFFAELFHLLDFAPEMARDKLIKKIDERFPYGFTMHYEAIVVQGFVAQDVV